MQVNAASSSSYLIVRWDVLLADAKTEFAKNAQFNIP